jgi:hypothetical protein
VTDFSKLFGAFAQGFGQAGTTAGGAYQSPPAPARRPDPHGRRPVAQTPEGGFVYEVPKQDYKVRTLLEEQPPEIQALIRARQA